MNNNNNDEELKPGNLLQSETFRRKEIFQHKQTADTGKAYNPDEEKETSPVAHDVKEEEKTSKEEGLNEQKSVGNAGAFEGFEDQQQG